MQQGTKCLKCGELATGIHTWDEKEFKPLCDKCLPEVVTIQSKDPVVSKSVDVFLQDQLTQANGGNSTATGQ